MTYSFVTQMAEIHVLLAWCAVVLFVVHAIALRWQWRWLLDSRVGVVTFGVHFLLAITGLSLWGLQYLNPLRDAWLMAKLLALAGFGGCAWAAAQDTEYRPLAQAGGLLLLVYIMGVSFTRSAWAGLA